MEIYAINRLHETRNLKEFIEFSVKKNGGHNAFLSWPNERKMPRSKKTKLI